MNRKPADHTEHGVHHSRMRPPTSTEEAQTRLGVLETRITQLEVQLDHADPDDYPSGDAYSGWRRRAMGALAYAKQERTYLVRWLSGDTNMVDLAPAAAELTQIAQRIRGRARELADEIARDHSPLFSQLSPPTNVSVAQDRGVELCLVKHRLQAAFSEISEAWTNHPLRRGDLPGVKGPLQRVLATVEAELSIVRGYIREKGIHQPTNWKFVCVGALTRAIEGGFVLTPEEQRVYDILRANFES